MRKQLDDKDKKILFLLGNNANLSLTDLEKRTKIPCSVIKKRLSRLEENKIIKAYKLNVNYKLLGFEEYEAYLRLMDVDGKKSKEIISSFVNKANVSWIGVCFGNYDIKMSFYARSNQESYNILSAALKGFRDHVKAQEVVSVTRKYKTDKTLFLNKLLNEKLSPNLSKQASSKKTRTFTTERRNRATSLLDETDKKIICALGKNPRSKLIDLSKHTKLTIQGIRNRLNSLERREIILGSNALINGQALGYLWATCLFKLSINDEDEKKLERYILNMPGTTSAVRLLGKWDLGITFFSDSIKDLQQKINDFKSAFKDCIKDYDALVILESYKYPAVPDCVFE